jgi:hypothetical protein
MYGDHQFEIVRYRQSEMHSEAAANHLARTDVTPPVPHARRAERVRGLFAHIHVRSLMHLPHVAAH